MQNDSISEIIDFAIEEERKAASLYEKTAAEARNSSIVSLLKDMAKMERGHEKKLQAFKEGKVTKLAVEKPQDLKISDYLVDVTLSDSSTLQDVLVFSIKAEQKAQQLYTTLADLHTEPDEKQLFVNLANEESRHKNDLEKAYDDQVYKEN